MNPFKRPLNVVFIILVAILITGGIITSLQLSKRAVMVKPIGTDYKVTLFEGNKKANKELSTFATTQEFSLYDGYYCYVVSGDKYNSDETCFAVYGDNKTVEIIPKLSDKYLDSILSSELPSINTAIQQSYGDRFTAYETIPGKIVVDDTWYVGILNERVVNAGEIADSYVFILKKTNGSWTVAVKPSLVISTVEYPQIPKEVAGKANTFLLQYVRSLNN